MPSLLPIARWLFAHGRWVAVFGPFGALTYAAAIMLRGA